jgi:hypothetical protein
MRGAALALVLMLASTAGVIAGDESFGPFSIRSDHPDLIYLDGDIAHDTYGDFARARRAAPDATTLILNSNGGDVDQAIRIARDVRALSLDTYVPLRHGCYSACAYIYFAGVNRRATGQLGVHQISDPAFTAASLQESIAELFDLFHDLGVDARITSEMLRTRPEGLYILDGREMETTGADTGPGPKLDALDDQFGHWRGAWDSNDTSGCRSIAGGAGWSGGCVPSEWIPTAPGRGEKYFYQDAEHQMGLVIVDSPGAWTRDELRAVVLEAVSVQRDEGASEALQEMSWPVGGGKFDLMVYPGRNNGGDVLYQHFYRALPQGGALQILIYSAAGQAWQATSKAAQLLSHLELDEAPDEPLVADTTGRENRHGEEQMAAQRSSADPGL